MARVIFVPHLHWHAVWGSKAGLEGQGPALYLTSWLTLGRWPPFAWVQIFIHAGDSCITNRPEAPRRPSSMLSSVYPLVMFPFNWPPSFVLLTSTYYVLGARELL